MDDKELWARCQIDWLAKASPDDWHRAALDFEWPQPLEPLLWIVSQPDCDKATALTIFWKNNPQNFLRLMAEDQLTGDTMPSWELLQFIAQRINDQSFTHANIAFDANEYIERDYDELAEFERQLGNSPLKAHPDMKQSINGRKIEADGPFAKRYPKEFHSTDLGFELIHLRQMEFLQNASPDDWHRYAWHHNWDDRLDGLFWIVSQPQCDRATALLTFWKGCPTGYDYENDDGKMGDDIYAVAPMLRYIVERFNTTGYTRSEIAYEFMEDHGGRLNPEYDAMVEGMRPKDIEELVERGQAVADPNLRLHPDLMVLSVAGRQVGAYYDGDFFERFPDDAEEYGVELGIALEHSSPAPQPSAPEHPTVQPDAPQPENSDDDASARVRAVRRQAEAGSESDSPNGDARSLLQRLKGLFGR
jgi:Domain of unknown function (DUF4274)